MVIVVVKKSTGKLHQEIFLPKLVSPPLTAFPSSCRSSRRPRLPWPWLKSVAAWEDLSDEPNLSTVGLANGDRSRTGVFSLKVPRRPVCPNLASSISLKGRCFVESGGVGGGQLRFRRDVGLVKVVGENLDEAGEGLKSLSPPP
jgi:hypothetical protein